MDIMNTNRNERIVTLRDLWQILVKRLVIMLLVGVVVAGGSYLFAVASYKPTYKSTATLYILRDEDLGNSTVSEVNSEYSLALKAVKDCSYLLRSRSVLEQVIDELDLQFSYETLSSGMSTYNPSNTRVLELTVLAKDPQLAKQIVDKICVIGEQRITNVMGYDQLNVYEFGTVSQKPYNSVNPVMSLLMGAAAAAVVYVVFVLAYLMDDRIRTDEDIQRYLGLSILGEIANLDEEHKGRYGYGYGYGNKSGGKKGS
jgi:capsular polysaccharide biosynthesis protein